MKTATLAPSACALPRSLPNRALLFICYRPAGMAPRRALRIWKRRNAALGY